MKRFGLASWFILTSLLVGQVHPVFSQERPPQFVREAVNAVITMLNSQGNAAIETFIDTSMVLSEDQSRSELIKRISAIRREVRGLLEEIAVEAEPNGVILILSNGVEERKIKLVLGRQGISDIQLLKPEEPLQLSRENLSQTFDQLETEGMAGVVYVRLGGEVVLKRAFGMANDELGIPNRINTIFATGSRPIDYTVAAIYLLDQQDRIHLDDTIDKYFEMVPESKRSITIRHLMTGQSGLPDFFHTEEDWDPDLAWIDRKSAEQRILSQKLLFKPGTNRKHSHGAFVLLAALIERVTGQGYYDFIRKYFLDPAGMNRTGEYGETRGLSLSDFAAGGGPQFVGLPNIPPNWGPTSWLIKGSGGMYSTLGDLRKFYAYVRSGKVLDEQHNTVFRRPSVNIDGNDRGFELFSAYKPPKDEIYLFLNRVGNRGKVRRLFRALVHLIGLQ